MPQSLSQELSDIHAQLDDLAAGLVAVPRGPGSIRNGMIAPNTVTASSINVQKLASVSTNTGALSVTGALTMTANGVFSAGQSAYNTGIGWWLEGNNGTPRFSLGDSSAQHLTWDGTSLSVTGVITMNDTSGSFGTVCKFQHSGVTTASVFCPSTSEVVFAQGATGTHSSLALTDTQWELEATGGLTCWSDGSELYVTDGLYLGMAFPGNTLTRKISDNGFQTEFSGGVKLGGVLIMASGNTGTNGSGTLLSPTKWIEFLDSSDTAYFVPAYSQHSPWAA